MNFDIKTEQLCRRRLRDRAGRRGRPLHGAGVQAAAARRDRQGREGASSSTSRTRRSSTRRRSACSSAGSSGCARTTGSSRSSAATATSRRSSRSPASTASSRSTPTRDEAVCDAELVGAHAELVRRGGALLALATALLAAGCGTGGISKAGDTDNGKAALPGEVLRLPHARRRRLARHAGPEPRRCLRLRPQARASSRRRSSRSSATRSSSPCRRCRRTSSRATTPTPSRLRRARRRPSRSPAKNATSGKDIFTANCGSCHTLEDAGTSGNVGPNLDQLKPSLEHRRSTR